MLLLNVYDVLFIYPFCSWIDKESLLIILCLSVVNVFWGIIKQDRDFGITQWYYLSKMSDLNVYCIIHESIL